MAQWFQSIRSLQMLALDTFATYLRISILCMLALENERVLPSNN